MEITLPIEPKQSILESNDFTELIDISILNKLINSSLLQTVEWSAGSMKFENEKHQLLQLKKQIKNNKLKVSYKRPKYQLGRVYPTKSLSLCSVRREIRHTLAHGKYIDIDIANCHPEILKQICDHNKIKTRYLKQYVENREALLEQTQNYYDCSRDDAKRLFIILAYYGAIDTWKRTDKEPFDFILDYQNELKIIGSKIIEANPSLIKTVSKLQKKNETGSAVSIFLQEKERLILECIYNYLVSKQIIVDNDCVLCFDGIMIQKNKYYPNLLEELSKVIEDTLGFKLKLTEKELNEHYLDQLNDEVDKDSFDYKKTEFEKNHCKIINKSVYIKQTEDDNIFLSKKDLKNAYEHITCTIPDDDNSKLFINLWTTGNDKIRCYDNFGIYPPPLVCPDNIYNLWMPFEAEKIVNYTPNKEALDMILNHIKILCNNEVEVADYFIKWIGQMIQYPAVKTICPTLISEEGAGKGTLNKLIQKMLGQKKCLESTNPSRDVWGNYNYCMTNSFFVTLNELSKKDTQDAEGKIKALITDGNLWVNPKGVNQFEINSYHRFFITTNKLEPISTSSGDRRNLIIRSSDELCAKTEKNIAYFNKLRQYLDDDNVIATCYNYFKSIPNLDKFNEIPIPKTEYQENLKQLSLSPPEQFIRELVIHETGETVEIKSKDIYNKFCNWCSENNVEYDITPLKLSVRLSNLNIKGVDKKHTREGNSTVLNIKKIKQHFKIDPDEFIDDEPEPVPEVEIPIEVIQKPKTKKASKVNTCLLDLRDE